MLLTDGWEVLAGAGGYMCRHRGRFWSTSVYATQPQAELAAETLETRALAVLAERGRHETLNDKR